jgi:hypothetical protein
LIIQEVDDEVLVYDERNNRAHCLNLDAARVWRASDGSMTEDELAASLELDRDAVVLALAELEEKELLLLPEPDTSGATRREFGLKAAKIGGAVAAGPMIYSIVAPTALATVTTPEIVCNFYSGSSCDACTGICGCCCCCQGCSKTTNSPACKMCSSISTCPSHTTGCKDQLGILAGQNPELNNFQCSSGPNCSATAKDEPKCSPGCIVNPNGVGNNALCPGEDPNNPNAFRGDFCPSLDCHTHDCNCFGLNKNPCQGF